MERRGGFVHREKVKAKELKVKAKWKKKILGIQYILGTTHNLAENTEFVKVNNEKSGLRGSKSVSQKVLYGHRRSWASTSKATACR